MKLHELHEGGARESRESEKPSRGCELSKEEFLTRIDNMRDSGKYDWAEDTLIGIYDNVAKWKRYSEGQLRAVRNVFEGRKDRPSWERFYEEL